MLERLLGILAQGGAVSYSELSRTLGVDHEMVQQMVEHLVKLGYLRPAAEFCGEDCGACPLEKSCSSSGPDHTWTLTEKGRRAAREAGQRVEHSV